MNKNPDGTELTDEQLVAIALEFKVIDVDKLVTKIKNTHNARSFLKEITVDARHTMWTQGRLRLDTGVFTPGSKPQAEVHDEAFWRSTRKDT